MIERRYDLTLVLQGPVLSQASGAMSFGLDMAMQRYQGEPVLNGSQIRGNIRHLLRKFDGKVSGLEFSSPLRRWFPDEDESFGDRRSPIVFDMFWRALNKGADGGVRTRIAIEADTGKVKKGALAVAEDLYPSGSCAPFHGVIHGRFADEGEADIFGKWLDKSLQWLATLGAQKGIGYGRLLWHELTASQPVMAAGQTPLPEETPRLRLRLELDRPFCIGRQVSSLDNRIISSISIPGQIIKGVLARRLGEQHGLTGTDLGNKLQELLEFDHLVVNHARPAPCGGEAPVDAIPLNLARLGDTWRSFDCADPPGDLPDEAPRFQPDWKSSDWQSAAQYLGVEQARPERYLLVRTAIDEQTGAAAESQLFSLECVDPAGFTWLADIDLSAVGEGCRSGVLAQLQALLAPGLDSIGKTRARASVRIQPVESPTLDADATCWQITLQTAARMLPLNFCPSGINGYGEMQQAYAKYWRERSSGSLVMTAHFARQRLAGGDYFHRRFREKNNKSYATELLTEPGSVFILEAKAGKEEDARKCLQNWLRQNLPAWQDADEPADWTTTVHIPQHGFGEISARAIAKEGGE